MPSATRAHWKGFLRLSLVSIGVEVYGGVDTKSEISFRQIHKPSGRRINYERVVQGIGEIENSDIVKGYEVDKDTYVTLEPEEIDAVRLESRKTIDLVQFVDAGEIDMRYCERPYYIAPADDLAGEGYVVIREALRRTGKVGLGQLTIGGRESLVAIAPLADGLMLEMLRYASELRDSDDFFDAVPDVKPDPELVDLAVELIGRKSMAFDAARFEDRYVSALKELVQTKLKGHRIVALPSETGVQGSNVVDLMEALRKSLSGSERRAVKGEPPARSRPARGRAAKRARRKA